MIELALLRSCSSPLFLDASDLHRTRTYSTRLPSTICCSSRNQAQIPKREPFSRSKLERAIKDPPLIEKSEKQLLDYCSTLEGDECYSCWQAYFELNDLKEELPRADLQRLILEAGGVESLIGRLHNISRIQKMKKNEFPSAKQAMAEKGPTLCPIPDGLPKSEEELLEEEQAKMPDSPYTRLLRSKGRFPAWYSPAPDHETD
ncbi:hypothetical protein L6164_031976 [Bauhinia variegata]|uniref:Uncharacterized protein n=1 Tax=Bauhinia variegata TaxID=167791 RepID=A0ACB9KMB8_BAUVA|nr:hypothetical protein L6164_031976 [Bauhinia variegata]